MNTMMKTTRIWFVICAATLLICACQPAMIDTGSSATQNDSSASDSTDNNSTGSVTTIDVPASSIELSGVQQVLAMRAVDALAAELGIDASQVAITEMQAVDWPDASLGCPEEGMMYAAMLTSGYKIMLEANGESHEYHSSDREESNVVKCEAEK